MLLSEESQSLNPLQCGDCGDNKPWDGSETSEEWTDATTIMDNTKDQTDESLPSVDNQILSQSCSAESTPTKSISPKVKLASNEDVVFYEVPNRTIAYNALDYYQTLVERPKETYKSKLHIFLCTAEELRNRMASIQNEKGQIEPKQLSTLTTASELHKLKTDDLINSITEICRIRSPFRRSIRMSDQGYYNWILVDLCRRMEVVQRRFKRDYKSHWEEDIRKQIINVIVDFDNISYYIYVKGAYKMIDDDGDYFDLFPIFVAQKRAQILQVADVIGDEICVFTEFIDMKEIGDRISTEHFDFLNDLQLSKNRLKSAIEDVKESNSFYGDPTSSYNKVELLNKVVLPF